MKAIQLDRDAINTKDMTTPLVVVSAYNYAAYLPDCLDSVAAQTLSDFRCLVVDDGSTDATAQIAREHASRDPRFEVVSQPNQGQLSVFNLAADRCQSDQWVCFLDADDVWSPRYLETVLAASTSDLSKCDFLFTAHQTKCAQDVFATRQGWQRERVDVGITSGVTRAFLLWIGNVTSTVSMRGRLLKRILPYPFTEEWRVRADDCLIMGASVAGARKGWIGEPLVYYRQHGDNNFAGNHQAKGQADARILALERFMTWMCQRASLPRTPPPSLVEHELLNYSRWHPHDLVGCNWRSAMIVREWPVWRRLMVYRRIRLAMRAASHGHAAANPPVQR